MAHVSGYRNCLVDSPVIDGTCARRIKLDALNIRAGLEGFYKQTGVEAPGFNKVTRMYGAITYAKGLTWSFFF